MILNPPKTMNDLRYPGCAENSLYVGSLAKELATRLQDSALRVQSTREKIDLRVPTLIVREAEPLLAWLEQGRALHILCVHNFTAEDDAALLLTRQLQQLGPCLVHLLHVASLPEQRERLGVKTPIDFEHDEPQVRQLLENSLTERVEQVLGTSMGFNILLKGSWGRPEFEVLEIAEELDVDLLVTGAQYRHGLGRLFHLSSCLFLAKHTHGNVFLVPKTH